MRSAEIGMRNTHRTEVTESNCGAKRRLADSIVPAEFANSHYRYKNVTARRSHLNISPKGRNISHARSAYFTAPQARFHTAAKLPYITAARRDAYSLLQPFGTKKSL